MPTHLVNLDALIRREDFEASSDSPGTGKPAEVIKLDELHKDRAFFRLLRKPDFQRETSNWGPETVMEFVQSFLDGALIPSIIMWHSPLSGKVFVIDGAHRLSALMAWVNNDYGDGDISNLFFAHQSPPELKRLAKRTRDLIEKEIGSYQRLNYVSLNENEAPDEVMLRRSRNMALFKIDSQWVTGDASTAEQSFFKINGNPVTIDPTELNVIKARRKPNAIATRALMRAGTGHKYWSAFSDARRTEIEKLAKEVYEILFNPILENPIKTLDLPIAGQGYSAESFKMLLDLVNIFNDVTPSMWQDRAESKRKTKEPKLEDDTDGSATLSFLQSIKKVGQLISGTEYSGSLGLHPAVYFWGATGKFHPSAFLATLKFVQELKQHNVFELFTDVRKDFEEFLVRHKSFINQVAHTKGSRTRSLDTLIAMYQIIFRQMLAGEKDDAQIVEALQDDARLKFLTDDATEEDTPFRKKFSRDIQTAGYLRNALNTALRCSECGARLHSKSMSKDHITRVEDGGTGELDNLQFTHPYCNSGYKEAKHARIKKATEGKADETAKGI